MSDISQMTSVKYRRQSPTPGSTSSQKGLAALVKRTRNADMGAIPLHGDLLALSVGHAGIITQGDRQIRTAYHKRPVTTALWLAREGLLCDEHVFKSHGGHEKAVCAYPFEHYRYWQTRLSLDMPEAAAFAENFTLTGLLERDVMIGDVYEVGEALVQVTQPRAPCYKIAARFGVPKMHLFLRQMSYTGYYLRVVEEGHVVAGQTVVLLDRQDHEITVEEANRILNVDKSDRSGAERMLSIPDLTEDLRPRLERRLEKLSPP